MDAAESTGKRCKTCGEFKPSDRFKRQMHTREQNRVGTCYDCVARKAREKRAADPEEWRRKKREYHAANVEQERSRMRAWRARNPRHNLRRRFEARGTGLPIPESAVDYAEILVGDPCAYCGGPSNTLDHLIPLSADGTHDWWNLTASCKACNSRKNDGTLLDAVIRGTMIAEMDHWATRWELAA